jgi:hypothetical protein
MDWGPGSAEQRAVRCSASGNTLQLAELLGFYPFQDGNGRLSRILTTLPLLQAGYAHA